MGKDSKIEWCHHTGNLWWGCTAVHAGCDNCYAEAWANRWSSKWGTTLWGNDAPRKAVKSVWKDFAKFQNLAKKANEIHYVFVGSMMDIFEKPMPLINDSGDLLTSENSDCWNTGMLRDRFFNEIIPNSPNLRFLLLTKRPSNINKYIPESWKTSPPYNVMFGTSPVDQKTFDKLVPQLLEVNGYKFLSIEPQLGFIDIPSSYLDNARYFELTGGTISWIINGGESGHGRRAFNPDWARSLRDQCKANGVSFFMKQIDKVIPIPDHLLIREMPPISERQLANTGL